MRRKDFLKAMAAAPLLYAMGDISSFLKVTKDVGKTSKMPVLFIGHGHPMNAIYTNDFTEKLKEVGASLEKPKAIMVVSAHWETSGTFVSINQKPETIYDFGRFDDRLFEISYDAPGHPELAKEAVSIGSDFGLRTHDAMGLDHGAWTILKHLFPEADIPVFQMSIDHTQPPEYHYNLAASLKELRSKGVLIIGSGNIVHNLRNMDWSNINANPFDWAEAFDEKVKQNLDKGDYQALVNYQTMGKLAQMAVPSNDHYLPMLYTLGLSDNNEELDYLFEGIQYGSISMRCFKIG